MGLRIREDYRSITGPEKSAILLMSLGEDQAGKLFALLDDEEIKEISQVMAGLGTGVLISSNVCLLNLLNNYPAQDPSLDRWIAHNGFSPKFWGKIV